MLNIVSKEDVCRRLPEPVDTAAEEIARGILSDVRKRGQEALYEYCVKFGDISRGDSLLYSVSDLNNALKMISREDRLLLERTADRIRRFAEAQKESLSALRFEIPGGFAGHDISPMEMACCYAPSGRFPLPSSVLMTAVTARVAGVRSVWVCSPRPVPLMLAAAAVAGADGFVAAGGAQAIAAFAFGAGEIPACDIIVGPGNQYVTAAKKLVSGHVAIDMLAGPSELTVLADASADPAVVAADLLAQAEHDVVAVPILVTDSRALIEQVNAELARQLDGLTTRMNAECSLKNGFAVLVDHMEEGAAVCNILAPEHLEIQAANADTLSEQCRHYGGLFIGAGTAEVLGDYGAGPNHTLPTGGTARYTGGLSVFHFLRIRSWIRIQDKGQAVELVSDAIRLAELEGLEGHARSAKMRR